MCPVLPPFGVRPWRGWGDRGGEVWLGTGSQTPLGGQAAGARELGFPGASTPISDPILVTAWRGAWLLFSAPFRDEKPRWRRPVVWGRPAQAGWSTGTGATSSPHSDHMGRRGCREGAGPQGGGGAAGRGGAAGGSRAVLPPQQTLGRAQGPLQPHSFSRSLSSRPLSEGGF